MDYAKEQTKSDWASDISPDVIEARQAEAAHDYWDLLWDDFNKEERRGIAGAFMDVVLKPEAYPNLFETNDYDAMLKSDTWQKLQRLVGAKSVDELLQGLRNETRM
jgi:hypothetical protein